MRQILENSCPIPVARLIPADCQQITGGHRKIEFGDAVLDSLAGCTIIFGSCLELLDHAIAKEPPPILYRYLRCRESWHQVQNGSISPHNNAPLSQLKCVDMRLHRP